MKEITKLMINEFKIKKLGYDFMGYKLQKDKSLTFHHLIIPRRNNGPETRWNGAIIQRIPHDYLHIIEEYDADLFCKITSEMIDINVKGYLDIQNLKNIHDMLLEFEEKNAETLNKKGKILIKEEYIKGRAKI